MFRRQAPQEILTATMPEDEDGIDKVEENSEQGSEVFKGKESASDKEEQDSQS